MDETIRTDVRIRLLSDDKFFGPGVCELLEKIEIYGSILAACKQMGMSYSKGSHIVKKLEDKMGTPMVQRWAGGNGGGGAVLTEDAKKLTKSYREMVRDVEKYTEEAFQIYFADLLGETKERGEKDEAN